jgi:acyl-CoA reductase-like NAD-dependent aldehyde dehydrogenase
MGVTFDISSYSGKTFETIDPRTGDVIANIAEGDKEDVDLAVRAAREAFDHGKWPRISGSVRFFPPSCFDHTHRKMEEHW